MSHQQEKINVNVEDYDLNDFVDENGDDDGAQNQVDQIHPKGDMKITGVHSASFKDMLLRTELLRAIQDSGFEHPSQVQQECIPHANVGRDVICQAVAGMGKTAVFVLAILHQLNDAEGQLKPASALILCNTRELAYQIKKEFDRFTTYLPQIRKEVFYGGVSYSDHQKIMKGVSPPHIVIGTPGRIQALIQKKDLSLDNLRMFVIDECDKMLEEMDMRQQVQKIFMSGNSNERQVMMFSATISDKCKDTCRQFMKDPFELYVDSESKLTLHGLKQYFVKLEDEKKIKKLIELLDNLDFNQVIVFAKTQLYAQKLNEIVRKEGFPSVACYRNMPQEERLKVYEAFKASKYRIMVCTDLFGRGIDVEKINVVINFDMPTEADQYLHRVGRAGRFGTRGLTISFISSNEDQTILQEVQDRFEVKIEELPTTIDKSYYMNN